MKKRGRKRKSSTSTNVENKDQFSEDWCFICKDGGLLLVCDFKDCLKAYHPECVEKDSSFLETGERWICSCHSCFLCRKSPKFYCYCCPNSVCKRCISVAEFVHVRRKNGFCNNCLKLALLIEENVDIDSDGGKIDFEDRDTYEFLFKGYWDIIKGSEHLTLEDLHSADILLKKGENFKSESDSEGEEVDEQLISNFGDMDDLMENGTLSFMECKGKPHATGKMLNNKVKSKKMEFIGWGSRPLINFLGSIGKDPSKPFTQYEVHDIIMEYIRQYKLNDPQKKKKIIFDARLQTVLGKKWINRNKIYDLLEPHFAANQEETEEDELGYNSEEEEGTPKTCKRQKRMSSDRAHEKEKVSEAPRSCFASITTANIKLVYLKRSLVEDFSRMPETFEEKVKGTFVRVKTDPNDYLQKNSHQLVQVIGVKNILETSDTSKDIILQISNMHKDVHIWMLSDDDFSEEECDDLHQKVKDGLLKRPTIWEFEQKAKILHEDITYHWIERELVLLQNLIDRANEKGWRRELCEYLEKQQLLQSPSERLRLMQEVPKVTADEIELEDTTLDLPKDENPIGDDSPRSILARASNTVEDLAGKGTPSDPKVGGLNPAGIGDAVTMNASPGITLSNSAEDEVRAAEAVKGAAEKDAKAISEEAQCHFDVAVPQNQRKESDTFVSEHNSDTFVVEEHAQTSDACTTKENKEISDVFVSTKHQSILTAPAEDQHQLNSSNVSKEQHLSMEVEEQGSKEKLSLNSTNGDQKKVEKGNVSAVEVIELDDEEDEDQGPGDAPAILRLENPESESWHYVDPFGDVQGPFSMMLLKKWSESNYFRSDFRVWKTGQSQESAILLFDALSQIFAKKR